MPDLTRRDVLKLMAAAAASEIVTPGHLAANITELPAPRYGLFFERDDLNRMRRVFNQDPTFADYRRDLLDFDLAQQRRFLTEELDYENSYQHMMPVASAAERMAFRYVLTGDSDAAVLAAECVRAIMRFKRWDFYMEAGRTIAVQRASVATSAIALACDWLGDFVSADERSRWIAAMAERGCEACYLGLYGIRYPREVKGWHFDSTSVFFRSRPSHRTDLNRRPEITRTANLRIIPTAALAVGAVAYRKENGPSEASDHWLEMATSHVAAFAEVYEEDGSYDEGIGYANYATLHLVEAMEILRRHAGTDLRRRVNWPGYAEYVLNMLIPTREDRFEIVNFGDNANSKPDRPTNMERTAVQAWIAGTAKNGTAQWLSNLRVGIRDHWSLMWYDPQVTETPPAQGPRLWISDLDWVVARSGFGVDDLAVAMRSGRPANHEHADRNSIIVKCFGEQLVTDPFRPPYLFAEPAWRMRLTEGHSAILIDGRGHEYHNGVEGTNASRAFARIVDTEEGPGWAYWLSNCTQPYRLVDLSIRSVVRKIVVLYHVPAVIVVDHVQKFENPSTVEARFFAYNYDGNGSVHAEPDGFVTTRPDAFMRAVCASDRPLSFGSQTMPVPAETAEKHPFGSVTSEAAIDTTIVTVLAIGETGHATPPVSIADVGGGAGRIAAGDWDVEVVSAGVSVKRR